MKKNIVILLGIVTLIFLQSCVLNCVNDGEPSFEMDSNVFNNAFEVVNLQSTYTLNDTIWISINIPNNFSSSNENIICNIGSDTLLLKLYNGILLLNNTDTTTYRYDDYFFKTGKIGEGVLCLNKNGNKYEAIF